MAWQEVSTAIFTNSGARRRSLAGIISGDGLVKGSSSGSLRVSREDSACQLLKPGPQAPQPRTAQDKLFVFAWVTGLQLTKNQRGVVAAEAKGIAHGMGDGCGSVFSFHGEVDVRVQCFQV